MQQRQVIAVHDSSERNRPWRALLLDRHYQRALSDATPPEQYRSWFREHGGPEGYAQTRMFVAAGREFYRPLSHSAESGKPCRFSAEQAVAAIDGVGKTIARVSEIAATIAAAVEEQSATTSEISRAIGETTRQTESMARSLERLLHAAGDTDASSQTVVDSASGLSNQAASLKSEVAEFVTRMKAA